MGVLRPMEVLKALKHLGFKDRPSVGDHITLSKVIPDHPDGRTTVSTGLDAQHCGAREVARIKRQVHLTDEMWDRAIACTLPAEEYDAYLKSIPLKDLVPRYWSGGARPAPKKVAKKATRKKKAPKKPPRKRK